MSVLKSKSSLFTGKSLVTTVSPSRRSLHSTYEMPRSRSSWCREAKSQSPVKLPCIPRSFHGPSKRSVSSDSNAYSNPPSQVLRVSSVFTILLGVGIGATAYGLYDFYTSFTLWPQELRGDLRAGVKAKNQGDLALSERYLKRAFETALALPPSALAPQAYLKLSGIAVLLAEVLNNDGLERHARDVLVQAWDVVANYKTQSSEGAQDKEKENTGYPVAEGWKELELSGQERLRKVAIAHKIGEMCSSAGNKEEEIWLTRSVEEVLKIMKTDEDVTKQSNKDVSPPVFLADLGIPTWMTKTDLVAPLEALGSFHARQEGDFNAQCAMVLYIQSISVLMTPNASTEDICHAAQTMNNVSELIMRQPPTPEVILEAKVWAERAVKELTGPGIDFARPRKDSWSLWTKVDRDLEHTCKYALGVALFNVGSLGEMSEDLELARTSYASSLETFNEIGSREGMMEVRKAVRRLDKLGEKANKENGKSSSPNQSHPSNQ